MLLERKHYLWNMITRDEILTKLKELKPILYHNYSTIEIGLFGSFSEDNFSDESNIDLLVEIEKPIGRKFFTLELYIEKIFNRKIDLVTKNALKEQKKEKNTKPGKLR